MPTEPKVLPLIEPIGSRFDSLNVDAKLVNALAEKNEQGELFVYKRPAFNGVFTLAPGTPRGMFSWRGHFYIVIDGLLYKDGASIGAVANSSRYWFTAVLGANPQLFLKNATNAYSVSTLDVVTAVVDPDYPATTVGGTAYLDGTLYVMDQEASIHGSSAAANDPANWDPLNLIVAQIEPTFPIHLTKQLVYLIAMKTGYTEAFYDAGNPTGSPLAPVQGAKMNYGCVDALTVRDVGGDLMWVADSGEGAYVVVIMSSLKGEVVSTPAVERILARGTVGFFLSWNAKIAGHRLYGITNTAANFTLVYDLTTKLWYQWTDENGNYVPIAYSCQGDGSAAFLLHATNGVVYRLDYSSTTDTWSGGTPFSCIVYTPNFDGGTAREKTLSAIDIVGDKNSTTLDIAISDDDYATWTTGWSVDMSLPRPRAEGFGSFFRRAFRLTHRDDTPFRLKYAELYLDVGT